SPTCVSPIRWVHFFASSPFLVHTSMSTKSIIVSSQGGESAPEGKTGASPSAKVKAPRLDQCGLENDARLWVRSPPLQRIRESKASPELTAKCRAHLEKIFAPKIVAIAYHPDEVLEIIRESYCYLMSEPVFIEDVLHPITIVGDLHGQLYDLARVFAHHAKDGKPGYECAKFLFLGNYVDRRGRQSVEVCMALFCLKILYPDKFILLRGNHEFIKVNASQGLRKELNERFVEVNWIRN
ncbi:hypothetical protein PENTCL1PPCAC_4459, partial [Pristionchus entomophagus]